MRAAFQGEPGAYSEEAVVRLLGEVETVPCARLADVFDAVSSRHADRAVVPAENSQAGSINETYDLLLAHALTIQGELDLRVSHCLLALPGEALSAISRAYSHPQALAQSAVYLARHRIEPVPFYDTAGSAKMIRDERLRGAAAVASRRAARIYGLEILAEAIETNPDNYTRFLAVGAGAAPRAERSKTSVVFVVQNLPGTLYRALGALAVRGINLTKIESRPGRARPWDYVFYADFEGHAEDPAVDAALGEMRGCTSMLRVLGSYPSSPPASAGGGGPVP